MTVSFSVDLHQRALGAFLPLVFSLSYLLYFPQRLIPSHSFFFLSIRHSFSHDYHPNLLPFPIGTKIMKFILAALALVASAQVIRSCPHVSVVRALINLFPVALHRFGSLRHLVPFRCTRQNDHSQRTADRDITLPICQRQQHRDEWNKRRDNRFANTNPLHGGRQPSCWISWRSRSGCRRTCFRTMRILDVESDVEAT